MEAGFLDEVAPAGRPADGLSRTARQALGYRELLAHLRGPAARWTTPSSWPIARTRRFARRQERWFRRDPRIASVPTGHNAWPTRRPGWETDPVQLTKHHGLGNDFLVALDEVNGPGLTIDGDLARACATAAPGIGADGLIHGARPRPTSRPTASTSACTCSTPTAAGPR